MKTSRIAPALALATLAALPALAPGQGGKPQKPPKGAAALTLEARPTTIVFGGDVNLDGRLTGTSGDAGTTVRLEADTTRPYGDKYEDTGLTTTTQGGGQYAFAPKPALNTQYRAVAQSSPPVTSNPKLVVVRMKVGLIVSDTTPRRGQRVRFRGTVAPPHDGAVALIQKRTSTGTFRTVARATLVDAGELVSRYSKRIRIRRDGVYRVKVRGDADHVNGFSRLRRLDVGG